MKKLLIVLISAIVLHDGCTETSADMVPRSVYEAEVMKVQTLQADKDSISTKLQIVKDKIIEMQNEIANIDSIKTALQDSLNVYWNEQLNQANLQHEAEMQDISNEVNQILELFQ